MTEEENVYKFWKKLAIQSKKCDSESSYNKKNIEVKNSQRERKFPTLL